MCDNCTHRTVCCIHQTIGGVKNCEHYINFNRVVPTGSTFSVAPQSNQLFYDVEIDGHTVECYLAEVKTHGIRTCGSNVIPVMEFRLIER